MLRLSCLSLLALLVACSQPAPSPPDDDDDSATVDDDDTGTPDDDDSGGADDDDSGPIDDDDTTPADIDGDGLPNDFEDEIGTDPLREDSDGDGYLDGAEYLEYFLPWDASDFPYLGGYPRGPLPEEVVGEGYDQGQITPDWMHHDQFDQLLHMHRFYGNVVVIYIDNEEPPPIGHIVPDVQAAYDELQDQGFVVLNFLIGGEVWGSAPDAQRFIAEHGLTFPVLEHAGQTISDEYQYVGFVPHFTVLDRELRIRAISFSGYYEWEYARALAEELLLEPAPAVEWPLP
jgi:peroxiredoxin